MNKGNDEFQQLLNEKRIKSNNKYLDSILQDFTFYSISQETDILSNITKWNNESQIITIDRYFNDKGGFFVICFDKSIINIFKSDLKLLDIFFKKHKDSTIFSLFKEIRNYEYFDSKKIEFIENSKTENFTLMIDNFSKKIIIKNEDQKIKNAISCYFIMKSFSKCNYDRIQNFNFNETNSVENFEFNDDKFIFLQDLPNGSSKTDLIYEIEREQIFFVKRFNNDFSTSDKNDKLIDREYRNYLKIRHPFLPTFYGKNKQDDNKYLITEYISGNSLNHIKDMNLTIDDKLKIIFEIMITLEYLHNNGFVYRDLKPNNIIIDKNKTAVLIDFDRMIYENEIDVESTKYFHHFYVAPEIVNEKVFQYSHQADIYSLGLLIYFIIFEKDPINKTFDEIVFKQELKNLEIICKECTHTDPKKRQKLSDTIDCFYSEILSHTNIQILNSNSDLNLYDCYFRNSEIDESFPYWMFIDEYNNTKFQEKIGINNLEKIQIPLIIKKIMNYLTLASKANHAFAQYELAILYYKNKYNFNDINKSIYYFSLASEQNYIYACFELGLIFLKRQVDPKNIEAGIRYFTRAAEQNHLQSIHNLGLIYLDKKYRVQNINKAIHYFLLGAKQNYVSSLYNLGKIYSTNEYGVKNIKKAIYYYTQASNLKDVHSQYNLALIYSSTQNKDVYDLNKSIYYYTLAADQNHAYSSYNLGLFYFNNEKKRDVNKAIKYLTIAANFNFANSQNILGLIYYYFFNDIDKSIYYLTLASNQNHFEAQFNLGCIYCMKNFDKRDTNKAIECLTNVANQQNYYTVEAQYRIGEIYYLDNEIEKAIEYLTLSANNNNKEAQYLLGFIHLTDKFKLKNINKSIYYLTLAANQNETKSLYTLGSIYFSGKIVPKDINKSIKFLSIAADLNDTLSQSLLGSLYFIEKNYKIALYYFNQAAQKNESTSLFFLGYLYYMDEHFPQNINKSIDYLKRAADQNHPFAQFYLGLIYCEKDIDKAIYYFSCSAKQNIIRSIIKLGDIYCVNDYGKKNIDKALYYYSLGAKLNDPYSQCKIGVINYFILNRFTVDEAIDYFQLSASQNYAFAQYFLGYIYGEKKNDINKSLYYFSLAEKNNDPHSLYHLGFYYLKGNRVKKDMNKAIYYFNRSAQLKYYDSYYVLGYIYFFYFEDEIKAIEYFTIGADNYQLDSLFMLGILYYQGVFVSKDVKKSINYLLLCANQHYSDSYHSLGFIFSEENSENLTKSIHYYKKSSSLKNQYSKNNLALMYKHGYGCIKNITNSQEMLQEAIKQKNDAVAMFNLANIYFYLFEDDKEKLDLSIKLLIQSAINHFKPSKKFLCFVLIKKYPKISINNIEAEVKKIRENFKNFSSEVFYMICRDELTLSINYQTQYKYWINIEYEYDICKKPCKSCKFISELKNANKQNCSRKVIDCSFYDGFGIF